MFLHTRIRNTGKLKHVQKYNYMPLTKNKEIHRKRIKNQILLNTFKTMFQ